MDKQVIYQNFGVSQAVYEASERALDQCRTAFAAIQEREESWQLRVLRAFQRAGLTEQSLAGTTGYGYDDRGREALEAALAELFSCERALLRQQFCSGTAVLSCCLKALLRPGDRVLIGSGMVYDTIQATFGIGCDKDCASLKDFHITHEIVELTPKGLLDVPAILKACEQKNFRMLYLQKSRGYSLRPALLNRDIEACVREVKRRLPDLVVMVDNCYGEFVEDDEVTAHGADLCAGSLIKNLGAGIAPSGAYVAGKAKLVELVAQQLTAPGVGDHVGPSLGHSRDLARGLFFAPHVVAESLRAGVHAAALFAAEGLPVEPQILTERGDIVQIIKLETAERLIAFTEAIQAAAAVDASYAPVPAPMPGYDCDIIMASGSFIQGSSIELSADGPLREPYAAFMQGGLSFYQARLAHMLALEALHRVEGANKHGC